MAETRDPDSEHSPYMRLPWPVVAAGVFVVLALALGFGFWANRNLRSGAAGPDQEVTPVVAVAPPVLTEATATPGAIVVSTVPATPEIKLTVVGTPASIPTSPTPEPALRPGKDIDASIADAYERYWQVRARALFTLDGTELPTAMTGDHLYAVEQLVDELRSEGHSIQTSVQHDYVILEASETDAVIEDKYVDSSVYVDTVSHVVQSKPSGATLIEQYSLVNTSGVWRVQRLVRPS
jgi:hypothetical protein